MPTKIQLEDLIKGLKETIRLQKETIEGKDKELSVSKDIVEDAKKARREYRLGKENSEDVEGINLELKKELEELRPLKNIKDVAVVRETELLKILEQAKQNEFKHINIINAYKSAHNSFLKTIQGSVESAVELNYMIGRSQEPKKKA